MMVCWCGHSKEDHKPKTVNGIYRADACRVCQGFTCDEWQPEFCEWVEEPAKS